MLVGFKWKILSFVRHYFCVRGGITMKSRIKTPSSSREEHLEYWHLDKMVLHLGDNTTDVQLIGLGNTNPLENQRA